MHQETMHAGKTIFSVDMAILLLSQLPQRYGAFYSSLITFGRMIDVTWEELVPMVFNQEDPFNVTAPKANFVAVCMHTHIHPNWVYVNVSVYVCTYTPIGCVCIHTN